MSDAAVGALWGGHAHFAAIGLDVAFTDFLEANGEAVDGVEIRFRPSAEPEMVAFREPDLRRPDHLPADHAWLPDISRRRPAPMSIEPHRHPPLVAAMSAAVASLPYKDASTPPYGTPTLEVRRTGVSLGAPWREGWVSIYAEDHAPYGSKGWATDVMITYRGPEPAGSDLLAAGGVRAFVLERFRADPLVRQPCAGVGRTRRSANTMRVAHLTEDAFARP